MSPFIILKVTHGLFARGAQRCILNGRAFSFKGCLLQPVPQAREFRRSASLTLAERVAQSVILNRIHGCATDWRHRTKKGSLSNVATNEFARIEHPINFQWTLKGT
jgi:hypothetical protein